MCLRVCLEVSKPAVLSQILQYYVARCFRLFTWATVKLLSKRSVTTATVTTVTYCPFLKGYSPDILNLSLTYFRSGNTRIAPIATCALLDGLPLGDFESVVRSRRMIGGSNFRLARRRRFKVLPLLTSENGPKCVGELHL